MRETREWNVQTSPAFRLQQIKMKSPNKFRPRANLSMSKASRRFRSRSGGASLTEYYDTTDGDSTLVSKLSVQSCGQNDQYGTIKDSKVDNRLKKPVGKFKNTGDSIQGIDDKSRNNEEDEQGYFLESSNKDLEKHESSETSLPHAMANGTSFHESVSVAIASLLESPVDPAFASASNISSSNSDSSLYSASVSTSNNSTPSDDTCCSSSSNIMPYPQIFEKNVNISKGTTRCEEIKTQDQEVKSKKIVNTKIRGEAGIQTDTIYSPFNRNESKNPKVEREIIEIKHNNSEENSLFLTTETIDKLDKMYDKMTLPNKTLEKLLSNIYRPNNHAFDNITKVCQFKMDRAFMTRRKNACGALNILASDKKNRTSLCWTVGVTSSITSVLNDGRNNETKKELEDTAIFSAYKDSRSRALAALLNMCKEPKNRFLIFHSPGLTIELGSCLKYCRDAALPLACSCLALLAKLDENCYVLLKSPVLMDAMICVIKPLIKEVGLSSKIPDFGQPMPTETDEESVKNLVPAQSTVFAILTHLCKAKHYSNASLVKALTKIEENNKSLNVKGIMILAHLTRHPSNCNLLVEHISSVLDTFIYGINSKYGDCRKFAFYALQNLSFDSMHCRILSNSKYLLSTLCKLITENKDKEEQLEIIIILKNLAQNGSCIIAFCNTGFIPILVKIIEETQEMENACLKSKKIQYFASDILATLSDHLQKVALLSLMSRQRRLSEEEFRNISSQGGLDNPYDLPDSVLKVSGWNQWQ